MPAIMALEAVARAAQTTPCELLWVILGAKAALRLDIGYTSM